MNQDQMTLGELIQSLQKVCRSEAGRSTLVSYTFGNFVPRGLHSFRGIHSELALGFVDGSYPGAGAQWATAGDLLDQCKIALDQRFEGYRGGDYQMTVDTPMWVSEPHSYTPVMLVDVVESKAGGVFIVTRHEDVDAEAPEEE